MVSLEANETPGRRHRAVMDLGQLASAACLMEVSAAKPGNVHRGADFEDTRFEDFALSAIAIAPAFAAAKHLSLGQLVFNAVQATRNVTTSNTNLGLILLMAPLAKAAGLECNQGLVSRQSTQAVLSALDETDSRLVFEAIRLCNPGGMGTVPENDINAPKKDAAPSDLLAAMKTAEERDTIARQYANGFQEFFEVCLPLFREALEQTPIIQEAIVLTHVRLMATIPDTLIGRKCGAAVMLESAARAQEAVKLFAPPNSNAYLTAVADLDFWLRSDGHRRNPGTTADLVGALLFVELIHGAITLPLKPFETPS